MRRTRAQTYEPAPGPPGEPDAGNHLQAYAAVQVVSLVSNAREMRVQSLIKRSAIPARVLYSSTMMFFAAQISLSCFGQTVTVTSPRCAALSRYMYVRACPMPPPKESGISSLRMAL